MTVEVAYGTDETVTADPVTGAVDGVYSLNEAHVAEAISHLIDLFRDGPRNQALLTALNAQVQEAEDAFWDHHNAFDVDTAVGDQLDLLGKRVGERRGDRSDAVFRAAIRVRILVNMSNGKLEELLAILSGLSPTATIYAAELYPATVHLKASTYGAFDLQSVYRIMKKAKAGGVRLLLTEGVAAVGAVDGSPVGGLIGAVDGSPVGFLVGKGT